MIGGRAETRWEKFALALAAGFFAAFAIAYIPQLGIQTDEALIAPVIFQKNCGPAFAEVKAGGLTFPTMLMSYVGALKGWLYIPIFAVFGVSHWSLRLPAALLGLCAAILFYGCARRLFDARIACLSILFLATDAVFILTATFDWGPVALQHFLLAAAAWVLTYRRDGVRRLEAAGAGLMCGLAIWNKAVVFWTLGGAVLSGILFYRAEVIAFARSRCLLWFAAGIFVGASPWSLFNLDYPLRSFTDAPNLDLGFGWKAGVLFHTLSGDVLMGYLVPSSGEESRTLFPEALCLALLLGWILEPRFQRKVAALFTCLFASWVLMVISGGGAPHHTILLAPLPALLLAAGLGSAMGSPHRGFRYLAYGLTAVVLAGNAFMGYRYLDRMIYEGGARGWTRATTALAYRLRSLPSRSQVYLLDWGLQNNLCLLEPRHRYQTLGADEVRPEVFSQFGEGERLAISAREPYSFTRDVATKSGTAAATAGLRLEPFFSVDDGKAKKVAFDVFRIRPAGEATSRP